MSDAEGLNAGAATFTPGAYVPAAAAPSPYEGGGAGDYYASYNDSDNYNPDDEAMMDEIEAEIARQGGGGGGGGNGNYNAPPPPQQQQQQQYSDLPPHAEEFWFPECRNCTCCNGYKHGCSCCATQGMRSCKCDTSSGGSSLMPAPPGPASSSGMAPPPHQLGGGYQQGNHFQHGGRGGGGRGGGRNGGRGRGPVMCRFFQSPQGCRFGDQCRFSHGC